MPEHSPINQKKEAFEGLPPLPSEIEADKAIRGRKNAKRQRIVSRGELYYARLNPVVGSEQGGERPVLVIQNNVGNKYSPTVIVAPITSQTNKSKLPTHVEVTLPAHHQQMNRCIALTEQIRTIDKERLGDRIGRLSGIEMQRIANALKVSLELK